MDIRAMVLGVVALLVSASIAAVRAAAWGIELAIPLVAVIHPAEARGESDDGAREERRPIADVGFVAAARSDTDDVYSTVGRIHAAMDASDAAHGRFPPLRRNSDGQTSSGAPAASKDDVAGSAASAEILVRSTAQKGVSPTTPKAPAPSRAAWDQASGRDELDIDPETDLSIVERPSPAFAASSRRLILLLPADKNARRRQELTPIYVSPDEVQSLERSPQSARNSRNPPDGTPLKTARR